ncbi:MAG: hypothetical protein M0Z84_04305 [Gammaproteobacteria bacterium]|nr:hypothetical protein [Gammaproteobacteria bacterium]
MAKALEEIAYSVSVGTDDVWIQSAVSQMSSGIPAALTFSVFEVVAAFFHGLPAEEVRKHAKAAAQRLRLAASDRAVLERITEEEVQSRREVEP